MRALEKYATGRQLRPNERHAKLRMEKRETVIGTWNIRTLNAVGNLAELEYEIDTSWNIIDIAEMRWLACGKLTTEKENKVWWSRKEKNYEAGVGFVVHKHYMGSVLECEPISCRTIRIRLAASPKNLSIIQVYAPTTDRPDEEVDAFYSQLENVRSKISEKDIYHHSRRLKCKDRKGRTHRLARHSRSIWNGSNK